MANYLVLAFIILSLHQFTQVIPSVKTIYQSISYIPPPSDSKTNSAYPYVEIYYLTELHFLSLTFGKNLCIRERGISFSFNI